MSSSRRGKKSCARCRGRKTKCDLAFPRCSSCTVADVQCNGLDTVTGAETPRSGIKYLESHIEQLESQLTALESTRETSVSSTAIRAVDQLENLLDEVRWGWDGIVRWSQPRPGPGHPENNFDLLEGLLLSPAPFPRALSEVSADECIHVQATEPLKRGIPLKFVPRDVLAILLKNYKENYLVQYPFLDGDDLDKSFLRVMGSVPASHFDHFCVGMALAISAMTLIRYDEQRATTKSFEFWNGARLHLPFIIDTNGHEVLRSILLLAHYSLVNPQAGDVWTCSGAAMDLALQMGLQHEINIDQAESLDDEEKNKRRLLWWATYTLHGTVHFMAGAHFHLSGAGISTQVFNISHKTLMSDFRQFPSPSMDEILLPDNPSYIAPHLWSIRILEADTINTLYDMDARIDIPRTRLWQTEALQRLDKWYAVTQGSPEKKLARTIQFHDIIYYFLLFRLNRACPANPSPDIGMGRQSIKAAIKIVNIYVHTSKHGLFFYIWHAAHQLFELCVFLLQVLMDAAREHTPLTFHQMVEVSSETIVNAVEAILSIFTKIIDRWPNTNGSFRSLESVSRPILAEVSHWQRGYQWRDNSLTPKVETSLHSLAEMVHLPGQQSPSHGSGLSGILDAASHDPLAHIGNMDLQHDIGGNDLMANLSGYTSGSGSGQHTRLWDQQIQSGSTIRHTDPAVAVDAVEDLWNLSSEQWEQLFASLNNFNRDPPY